jgi:hypothetical protein
VHYHNHSVEQLAALLTDSDLCRIRWPPAELVSQKELGFPPVDWNAPHYQQAMANVSKCSYHLRLNSCLIISLAVAEIEEVFNSANVER